MKIAAILASLALTVPAKSFTCNVGGDWGDDHRDCSKTSDAEGALADICYYDKSGTAGCLPTKYEMLIVEAGKAGCTDNGCWCMTSDCNTQAWFDSFKASYVPPPQCYSGIAGANQGPQCKKTDLYEQLEFKAECYNKLTQNMCVENNPWLGHGDGCQDDGRKEGGKELCESYQDGTRDADDSYDGTTKHCIWMPPLNTEEEKRSACESELNDDGSNMCAYNNNSMSCEPSAASTAKTAAWMQQRGSLDCESRLPIGCVENNDSNGKSEKCTDMTDESSCLAVAHDCSQGTCAGTANSGPACENRNSRYTMAF